MGKIDLGKMDAAAEELWEEAKRIRHLLAQTEEIFTKIGAETDRGWENPEKPGNALTESGRTGRDLTGSFLTGAGLTEAVLTGSSLMGERPPGAWTGGKKDRVQTALTKAESDEICERLQTQAAALEKAASALRRIRHIYKEIETRVIDVYDGEYVVLPKTIFATSHFENLRMHQSIIPVRPDTPSGRETEPGRPGADGPGAAAASMQKVEKLEDIL